VHRLFEQQAERTPEADAVMCDGERLTFRELNVRANRLTRYLQRRGVGLEVPVAVCLERSAGMVVCMLAVLKAGGAYVPLEPTHPKERLAVMLEEARAPFLLTRRGLADGLRSPAEVLLLDGESELISSEGGDNLPRHASPENLAYVLFTSGSTGRPKGVAVEQRSLCNYVRAVIQRFDFRPGAGYAMVSNFATDLAHTVIFPALCGGGCLHVLTREQSQDARKLADYFEQHPVDYLKVVPTHLSALLAAADGSAGRVLPRRRLILGGEASSWALVDKVRERAPECAVDNHYGPTEATVGVLTYRVEPDSFGRHAATLPLGRPLANVQVYLLDANLHPVPPTVTGELYIGGSNLARGYFNLPGLTAERFIPDPFSGEPGARLYRTGDLARYLPDGNMEFLGRADSQVKIRGHRVELGEIEAALRQHPSVREAAALVVEDVPESRRLVAYVTLRTDASANPDELRAFLRGRLPDFMLPSSVVTLGEFPLTPNGKLDRGALPRRELTDAGSRSAYAPPQSEIERIIAALWEEALQLERVSVEDNLFDLGGHSLVLLQVQGKLREALRREVSIVDMFEHPTVSSLARHLGRTTEAPTPLTEIPQPAGRREELRRRRSHLRDIHQAERVSRESHHE
jgi:amino acid adenylation domain-containing protein